MVLFSIPDIRLFWSTDPRFLSQFTPGQISTFKPYSKYPPCLRDMSFWLPRPEEVQGSTEGVTGVGLREKAWHENDYCEIVRDVAGDLVESVVLVCQHNLGLFEWSSESSRSTTSYTPRRDGRASAIASTIGVWIGAPLV